jgi:hypothetical protein
MGNQNDAGSKPEDRQQQGANVHGEGNYAATRQYNEGVREHMQAHDIDKEARDAAPKSADEARELESAEAAGKSRAKGEDPALARRAASEQRGPDANQTPKPGQEE